MMPFCCSLERQLKFVAIVETMVSSLFLIVNFKILIQLMSGQPDPDHAKQREAYNLSESALIMYFFIRVLYLIGELLLAIFLTYNVYRRNVNALILWFFMTVIFSIPSRCYFIGGVLWGHYFYSTLLIFTANLAFTSYSLVIICLHVKNLTRSNWGVTSRRGSVAVNELTDTFLDFI